MFKRSNSVIIVLTLLLSILCSLCVVSAENSPQLMVEMSRDRVPAGGRVTAEIKLTGNVDGISGIVLELEYGDRLRLVDAKPGEKFYLEWDKSAPKKVAIATGESVIEETVTLARLTFKIDEDAPVGDLDLTVKTTDATDGKNNPLSVDAGHDVFEVAECEWGDVNGNYETDILDALVILRYLVGLNSGDDLNLTVADTDHSGEVNIEDARLLMKYEVELVGWDPCKSSSQK